MKCRAGLECELHALRIRKTKLKPLEDQNAILEALVEKRSTHFTQSEQNVQTAIAEMESAKQSLMVAQQQLLQVRELKKESDAAAAAAAAVEQQQAEIPDNMKSVQKMQDLVCLLPIGMAEGFGQCLKLLEGLLQQANASTVTDASNIQEVRDGDSTCSGATGAHGMEQLHVPIFPGGDQPLHGRSLWEAESPSDPYMASEGTKTPPRRARSVEPERSREITSYTVSHPFPFSGPPLPWEMRIH